jgi:pimeloyl-ACP methyl ester carboxylesterase
VGGGPWRERLVPLRDTVLLARQRPGRGPVIVFEAGLGLPGSSWREVCDRVPPDRAQLCYDRAGLGGSAPGTSPRSGQRQVRELRELLGALGLPPPYVLVGHSAGAFIVRLFALRHPGEVAGIVLVDPAHEDEPAARRRVLRWWDAGVGRLARPAAALARTGAPAALWRLAAGTGLVRPGPRADLLAELTSARHLTGLAREEQAFATTAGEVRRAQRDRRMPDVPVRVITAERSYHGWSPFPRSRRRERDRIRDLHRALAGPRGAHLLAPHSGHLVMHDDPHLIAAAIEEVS